MLTSAHQGYIYQDILGAYFIANELWAGRGSTQLLFDQKKTSKGIPDRFDDITIYNEENVICMQVKYSNEISHHRLTKQDFSAGNSYDLALFDLFDTWKALRHVTYRWRILLAWDLPNNDDPITEVLLELPEDTSLLTGTTCFKFNMDALWPLGENVFRSWTALSNWAASQSREEFRQFLDDLIIEVGCPKSSLLLDFSAGLEMMLAKAIDRIGIGVYPNDHLSVIEVAERLCSIVRSLRSKESQTISCDEVAQLINIKQTNGGIEQKFVIDESVFVQTPERVSQVLEKLEKEKKMILTAEPGAGKSWLIANIEREVGKRTNVIKHYCYLALNDPLSVRRITVNILYANLITQILSDDDSLHSHMTRRYASNLEQLNILLRRIRKKTLIIIDGIDHIWRVYQRNRGGLTEDETTILQAIGQLDITNPKISVLVISQPISQLSQLATFHVFALPQVTLDFAAGLMKRNGIRNTQHNNRSLAETIHTKSDGNALYCKYLIDHIGSSKTRLPLNLIDSLPAYDYNLKGYYGYLYEQILGDTGIPYALCGADFSLTENELREITHLGELSNKQLEILLPVVRYKPSIGYSIYHESFKRFVIDLIISYGASIEHLVYKPLINWLKNQPFFESQKAYSHLLKLCFEIGAFEDITKTISADFIEKSLYHAQPLDSIRNNHYLQRKCLQYTTGFLPIIIVSEQAKIIYQLKFLDESVMVSYLTAIQQIHGPESMYRVLWNGENLSIGLEAAVRFLVNQAYKSNDVVHWGIIPEESTIPLDLVGSAALKHLHTRRFDKFEKLIKVIYRNKKFRSKLPNIVDELDKWSVFKGADWETNVPYYQKIKQQFIRTESRLSDVVRAIIQDDHYSVHEDVLTEIRSIPSIVAATVTDEVEDAVGRLAGYNWFRNWVIFFIRINQHKKARAEEERILDTFSYLVRDLEPFKGKPRVNDLYYLFPIIKRSFHEGLLLCNGNSALLLKCCEYLERVTEVTTSMRGAVMGPLTHEEYLEIISRYLPNSYVVAKYKEYYKPLGSRRYYSDVAETAFNYALILNQTGEIE
ncbi:ATP-binding protein [Dyadobacter sp. CY326]|uniref:ATP-binding protein n=1 Tax=Dyadobacter sp. CY326 TaxID=2907300 RepID=UPI001F2490F7|nr:ATP-binding protein [Dyadobacter sp. CY326]MCE7064895.1 ATP-binding protein [Dyadobacter sp. CY326]